MLEDKISRRTFLKLGGLVAVGGLAAWLGLNALAPEYVQGPKKDTKKYVTAQEFVDAFNLNGDVIKSTTYKPGDTVYLKDDVVGGRHHNPGAKDAIEIVFGAARVSLYFEDDGRDWSKGDPHLWIATTLVLSKETAMESGYSETERDEEGHFRTPGKRFELLPDYMNWLGKNTISKA